MVLPLRDDNPTRRRPVWTIALIVLNVAIFFFVQPEAGSADELQFLYRNAAIPCELREASPLTIGEIRTGVCALDGAVGAGGTFSPADLEFAPGKNVHLAVLVSLFLHGSLAHLFGNMLFLWVFGNNVEDRFGPIAFPIFYVLAGVAATLAHVAVNSSLTVPLIGASGAIAGVMGAYLIWFPNARVLTLLTFFPVYLPAAVVLVLWFGLQFATNPNAGVAWVAHVGGFVFGAGVALLTRGLFAPSAPRPARPPWFDGSDDDWDGGFRGGYPGRT